MNPVQTWQAFQDKSLYYQAVKRDGEESCWREIARNYDQIAYPEQQQEILCSRLMPRLEGITSAIEIGAGPGSLTLPLARRLSKITAVEPSPAMSGVLVEKLRQQGLGNVTVLQRRWEEVNANELPPADVVLAGGCLYVFYEIDRVLRRMLAAAHTKVLLTHIGTEGLPVLEQQLADRLSLPQPCLFPPLSLVLEVLIHLRLPLEMEIFFLKRQKRWSAEQWLERWQRLFAIPSQQRPHLLGFLEQECRKEGDLYCWEEISPVVIIELRKTP